MSENSVNQPSLSARELVEKIMDATSLKLSEPKLCCSCNAIMWESYENGYCGNCRAASLIDQAIEDAANPYKEAFEELVKHFYIDPKPEWVGVRGLSGSIRAPLTRALLTKEEKSE